jgi:signal peptidase I
MLLGRAPQNGEIVVFRYPKDKAKLFVKRVVGVPKDRLRMEGERLYRNGALVKEEHAVYRSGRFRQFERFPPSDDSGWGRAEDGNPFANNIENGEVVVPDGQYFVLGDNRDNSLDSRYWGFVPNEDILARAVVIYGSYEPDEDSGTPSFLDRTIRNFRWSRVLKRLS